MFQSESDVREWLRAASGGKVWWFENKRGGTFGFPDAMVVHRGRPVFLELKIAEGGCIEAHPSQLNVVRDLRSAGLDSAFLCGVRGGSLDGRLLLVLPDELERVSANERFGGRRKYQIARKRAAERVFSGSEFYRILEVARV